MSDDIIEAALVKSKARKTPQFKPGYEEKRGRPRKKLIDTETSIAKTITLAATGLPPADIAKVQGVAPNTVTRRLDVFTPLFAELKNVESYRLSKADILEAAELAALKRVLEVLPSADVRSATFAFDKIFTAGRLTRGESTANISNKVTRFTEVNLTEVLPQPVTLVSPE